MKMVQRPVPPPNTPVEVVSFVEFLMHGLMLASPHIHDGYPWSFTYRGCAVSHENNECYILSILGKDNMHRNVHFTPKDVIVLKEGEQLEVITIEEMVKQYTVHDSEVLKMAGALQPPGFTLE